MKSSRAATIWIGVMVASLVACTQPHRAGVPMDREQLAASLVPDQTRWRLPLDDYSASIELMFKADAAEDYLIYDCMRGHGETSFPRPPGKPRPESVTRGPFDQQLMSKERATEFGYHDDWRGYVGQTVYTSLTYQKELEAWGDDKRFTACQQRAWSQLRPDDGSAGINVRGLALDASERAESSAPVVAAARKWRTCMAAQAVPDLPQTPIEMPSNSVYDMVDPETEPTAREIAVATADAACRESSGYSRILYQTEWDLQLTALAKRYAQLQPQLEEVQAHETRIDEILAAHGA